MNSPIVIIAVTLLLVVAVFASHRFGRLQADALSKEFDHYKSIISDSVRRAHDTIGTQAMDVGRIRSEMLGEIERKAKQHALELQSLRESLTNRYTNVQSRVAELEHVPNEASAAARDNRKLIDNALSQIGMLKVRVGAVEVNHRRLAKGELDRIKNAVIAMAAVTDPAGRVEVSRAICRAVDALGKQSPEGGSEPEGPAA